MKFTVMNAKQFNCASLNVGEVYEAISFKKAYVLMRINSTFIPFRLSKSDFKKIFDCSEENYNKYYLQK